MILEAILRKPHTVPYYRASVGGTKMAEQLGQLGSQQPCMSIFVIDYEGVCW